MSYVILAELRARPQRVAELAELLDRHAAASRAEATCGAFEIHQDRQDPALFVLYEAYDDEDGYQAHRRTEHYRRFSRLAPALVVAPDEGLLVSRRVLRRRPPPA